MLFFELKILEMPEVTFDKKPVLLLVAFISIRGTEKQYVNYGKNRRLGHLHFKQIWNLFKQAHIGSLGRDGKRFTETSIWIYK